LILDVFILDGPTTKELSPNPFEALNKNNVAFIPSLKFPVEAWYSPAAIS
jgi:hypothetical protein